MGIRDDRREQEDQRHAGSGDDEADRAYGERRVKIGAQQCVDRALNRQDRARDEPTISSRASLQWAVRSYRRWPLTMATIPRARPRSLRRCDVERLRSDAKNAKGVEHNRSEHLPGDEQTDRDTAPSRGNRRIPETM